MTSLSAYLIVKNEVRDLPACLESLKGLADQIVVVDDESTDGTRELCRQWGAKVFTRKLDGFGTQKQYALDQCTGEWVLSIDADERVTPALAREIRALLLAPAEECQGYYISRNMFFLGHRLRHGGVGQDWVLRLFKRKNGRYMDKEIHEQVTINGRTRKLRFSLDHYSYATLSEYLEKVSLYTNLAAIERWKKGKRFASYHHLRPLWELFVRVVLKSAWRDGQPGLVYAALSSHMAWLRSVRLWELGDGDQ